MAIHEADHEPHFIGAKPGPSGIVIFASIDTWMMMHHMRGTSLSAIELISIGRDNDRIICDLLIVQDQCAHVRPPHPNLRVYRMRLGQCLVPPARRPASSPPRPRRS